ncbi:MAG TPA: lipase maturation factor family protein [Candidatus Binatia bacterium]|nr:lipase maturation factor family protein [Candidatus Binatia bacterium]
MSRTPASVIRWLFSSEAGVSDRLLPRWIFLRCLGLIYFSAFYALLFQICGLIGPDGILPAREYLEAVARQFGGSRFWFAPTLLWLSSGGHMLTGLCWAGMIASLLVVLNVWPRATLLVCLVCFLSFVAAAQDFSGYQSDGMLLEAGFISLFFAPAGLWPGLGRASPPSHASLFLLLWEWFRIYFGSGVVKLASGDPEWRNFTAMDEYYQNGPLPTWIGWYVQHLPHWFHAVTTGATLVLELSLVFMMFLPRRWRIACFFIATLWQIPVILTANYTFLNYLVLVLGFLLLDDAFLARVVPGGWRHVLREPAAPAEKPGSEPQSPADEGATPAPPPHPVAAFRLALTSVVLLWIFYATTAQLIWMLVPGFPLPRSPVAALEPFRIANRYGLFAVMTRGRYEVEFQGSEDGENWVAYPFRYKPQDLRQRPRIYAPYQPRFDWNLWFASLGSWRENLLVPSTEERLLAGAPDVLALFAGNPFPHAPPKQVRAVLWQYWFTSRPEKRATGMWWRRELIGLYAPVLEREPDGRMIVVQWPESLPRRE